MIPLIIIAVIVIALACAEAKKKRIQEAIKDNTPVIYDAHWATKDQLKPLRKRGIPIGRDEHGELNYAGDIHLMTFAGSGKGKTTNAFIPAALQWPYSLIVLDTAEIAATTAHYRRKFGPVYQINPNGHCLEYLKGIPRVGYNVLGKHWLDPNNPDTFASRAKKRAEGCVRQENDHSAYWYTSSTELVQAISMFLVEQGGKAHIGMVAEIVRGDVKAYAKYAASKTKNRFIRNAMLRWINSPDDIRSLPEVVQNTCAETAFLLEDSNYETFSRDDITFMQCKKKVNTIYIILSEAENDGRMFNMLFNCALGELMRLDPGNRTRTLILADEYRSLGFRRGDEIFTRARKYNTQLWIALHGIEQLKELHPKTYETFMDSAGVIQFMSATDLTGSTYVSNMSGDAEIRSRQINISYKPSEGSFDPQIGDSMRLTPRKLVLPHEVRALANNEQILWVPELVKAPIKANRGPFFKTKLNRKTRPNPFAPQKKKF